jgi:sugar (pentulose or hexulose) kinase
LNVHSRQVEPRVLETLGLSHLIGLIPPLLQPSETVAGLLPAYAERLGLRSGLPVVLAPFDVVAEMISVGGSEAGVACSVLGTSGIHEVSIERLVTPVRSGDTTYIPGCPSLIRFIPMMLAVPNIEYWGKLLFPELVPPHGYAGWEVLEAQVRAVRPGADGLLYLPFLSPSGERSPYFMPHAHAQFMGLSLSHRREHLMRAVYEGLALATADSFSHLPRFTGSLRLTGGGANSTLLAQIIADVLNCTVEIHDNINGAMRGAIMYAQVQLGYYDTLHDAFTHMEHRRGVCTPDAQAHTTYGQLQQHYRERVRHEWLHE